MKYYLKASLLMVFNMIISSFISYLTNADKDICFIEFMLIYLFINKTVDDMKKENKNN